MTRHEYLEQLDRYLRKLPKADYEEAMDYFTEYFDEAGVENEAAVMAELGTPKEAAHDILSQLLDKKMEAPITSPKSQLNLAWVALLGLFAAPIALPVALVVIALGFAGLVTLLALLFSVVVVGVSFVAAGVYLVFDGLALIGTSLAGTVFGVGVGLAFVGLSLLTAFLGFEAISFLVKALVKGVTRLIQKGAKS